MQPSWQASSARGARQAGGKVSGDRVSGARYGADKDLPAELLKLWLGRDCPRDSCGQYAELEQPEGAAKVLPE